MLPFKPNKSVLAYARVGRSQGKQKNPLQIDSPTKNDRHSKSYERSSRNQRRSENGIYEAIMGELEHDQNAYINKLIGKTEKKIKNSAKDKNIDKRSHERAKSYANIMIQNHIRTPSSNEASILDTPTKIMSAGIKSPRSQPFTCEKSTFRTLNQNESATAFKKDKNREPTSVSTIQFKKHHAKRSMGDPRQFEKSQDPSFLESLDGYLEILTTENKSGKIIEEVQAQEAQEDNMNTRATRKPSRQQSSKTHLCQRQAVADSIQSVSQRQHQKNVAILKKLEQQEKKITELKLNNHLLKSSEKKCFKKLRLMKSKMYDMYEYIRLLEGQIHVEKQERLRIQEFLTDFQVKASSITHTPPVGAQERRTAGYRQNETFGSTIQRENADFMVTNANIKKSKSRGDKTFQRGSLDEKSSNALGKAVMDAKSELNSMLRLQPKKDLHRQKMTKIKKPSQKSTFFKAYESYEPSINHEGFFGDDLERFIQSDCSEEDSSLDEQILE